MCISIWEVKLTLTTGNFKEKYSLYDYGFDYIKNKFNGVTASQYATRLSRF